MSMRRLPQTDSIQELAAFWDTHDLTEFEDELEEVDQRVFERDVDNLLRLYPEEAKALRELARSRGMAEWQLIRQWVIERLRAG